MTEIRDRDLRFTPEEMTAFLNALHRLNLPAEQITALESRTEGWAAGVQLAALSLQGCSAERAAQFISAFSGSHHYIVDYLFDEVLSRQPDAVREFLLQTSILDRMCAPLCDAVLGWGATEQGSAGDSRETALAAPQHPGDVLPPRSPAQEILEYLERSNLFLVPLDDERRWYRYHHLFVDVLRQMLQVRLAARTDCRAARPRLRLVQAERVCCRCGSPRAAGGSSRTGCRNRRGKRVVDGAACGAWYPEEVDTGIARRFGFRAAVVAHLLRVGLVVWRIRSSRSPVGGS